MATRRPQIPVQLLQNSTHSNSLSSARFFSTSGPSFSQHQRSYSTPTTQPPRSRFFALRTIEGQGAWRRSLADLKDRRRQPVIRRIQVGKYKHSEQLSNTQPLNHLTESGEAHMVSIANKVPTSRSATATSTLLFSKPQTYESLVSAQLKKGDAIAVARIAGIQAAKKTSDLIPLAHPSLAMTGLTLTIKPFGPCTLPPNHNLTPKSYGLFKNGGVYIEAKVDCEGKTGVEMEAMMGASVAGLTMYDMLKGVDKAMTMTEVRVLRKSGGKSGAWSYDYATNKIKKADKTDDTHSGADWRGRGGPVRNQPKTPNPNNIQPNSYGGLSQEINDEDMYSTSQQQDLEPFITDEWAWEGDKEAKADQSDPVEDQTSSSNDENNDPRGFPSEEVTVHHDNSFRTASLRANVKTCQQDVDHGRLIPVSKINPQLSVNRILDTSNTSDDEPDYERKVLLKRGLVTYRDLVNARIRRWQEKNDTKGAFFSISTFLSSERS
ncbi:hypothetical protein LTR84_013067 [Exophiala bonariae]|uniref:cyclic pyranopterin monophosphate synthase n=1 Tax=Exophiala bonariae TaxID=1690606 RepID=A0AAV9NEY8_9EURO|nr:hypothetical protein LTR84_013067 [Exophiala bonariae]